MLESLNVVLVPLLVAKHENVHKSETRVKYWKKRTFSDNFKAADIPKSYGREDLGYITDRSENECVDKQQNILKRVAVL